MNLNDENLKTLTYRIDCFIVLTKCHLSIEMSVNLISSLARSYKVKKK